MLVDAIKSIFIPHDGFFQEWLDDLNSYFGDTFGILYYPFELLIDFLNRIGGLNETGTAIIHIPEFSLNLMGYTAKVIPAYDFDFNSILVNDTYKNIHNVYLIVVDVILWLGLLSLVRKLFRSIFGGVRDDDIKLDIDDINTSDSGTMSASTYKPPKHMK